MFIIDNVRSRDDLQAARAETFLAENPDPGVRLRPREQLQRAFDAGFGLSITRDDATCAVSLIYEYDVKPPGQVFHEIGTQRVSIGGHGLQVALAVLHMVQIEVLEDGEPSKIFAVVSPETASEHNLVDVVGMSEWTPPDALAVVRASEGAPFVPGKRVIAAPAGVVTGAFAMLRGLHRDGRLFSTPRGNSVMRVDMAWFEPSLLEIR